MEFYSRRGWGVGSERVRSIPGQHSMGLVFSVSLSGFTVTALSPSPPPPPHCRKGASARAEACKSGRWILASQRSGLSRHSLCSLSDSSCLRSGASGCPITHRSLRLLPVPSCRPPCSTPSPMHRDPPPQGGPACSSHPTPGILRYSEMGAPHISPESQWPPQLWAGEYFLFAGQRV